MPFTKKTAEQIKGGIVLNLVENVDEINDANIGSGLDLFATGFSLEIEEQYQDLQNIFDASRISTATGDDLEELGLLLGVQRNQGSLASGDVSFVRNEPAVSDFTIPLNSIVSTRPSTETTQLEFETTSAVTFPTNIVDESHTFRNGVYRYRLDQRFIDSISTLDGTSGSSPTAFTQGTDYSIVEDFDGEVLVLDNFKLVDDAETVGDWTAGDEADAPTANTSEFYEGTQSINMLKSGTTTKVLSYTNTLSSVVDLTDVIAYMRLFVKDSTQLDKIDNITIFWGSGGSTTDSYDVIFEKADLSTGWNRLKLDRFSSETDENGSVNVANVNFLKIRVDVNNTTDTFSAGDLLFDMWFVAEEEAFEGDIVLFDKDQTIPDDNTTFEVDYVPLSVEVPVQALSVGEDFNVAKGKIVYKVTSLTNIDRVFNYTSLTGGVDIEEDDAYRIRIQNATLLKTNATAEAIRFSVLDLDFVSSVVVDDTPLETATAESHVFSSGTDKYHLDHEVAVNDATLKVGDTAGATDYTNGTDYALTEQNEIDWSIGGTSPSDGNTFFVDYTYNDLGHFDVFVVGAAGPLTSEQLTEVEEVVDETRAAGTVATVLEPTFISVDVTVTLTIDSDFSTSTVQDEAEDAIRDYFETLGVGDDVLVAGIINFIMEVDGVDNVSVDDIGGGGSVDFTIASDEVATEGTITVN